MGLIIKEIGAHLPESGSNGPADDATDNTSDRGPDRTACRTIR